MSLRSMLAGQSPVQLWCWCTSTAWQVVAPDITGLNWPASPLLRNPQPSQQCYQRNWLGLRLVFAGGAIFLTRRWRQLAFPLPASTLPGGGACLVWAIGSRSGGPTGYAIILLETSARAIAQRYFPLQVRAHQIGGLCADPRHQSADREVDTGVAIKRSGSELCSRWWINEMFSPRRKTMSFPFLPARAIVT